MNRGHSVFPEFQTVSMSLNMRIFVGVDCDESRLMLGLVGSQGILKGLSTITSPALPEHLSRFGTRLHGMIPGLRGELNLRMKNFSGIGIGLPSRYLADLRHDFEAQIKPLLNLPVYLEDRDVLAVKGKPWLEKVVDLFDPGIQRRGLDLSVVYGAAKLAIDSAPSRNG